MYHLYIYEPPDNEHQQSYQEIRIFSQANQDQSYDRFVGTFNDYGQALNTGVELTEKHTPIYVR